MLLTKHFREKYKKRVNCRGIKSYPAGGKDIYELCDVIDSLEMMIEDAIRKLPDVNLQNEFGGRLTILKLGVK